ncbi:Txe/YoeB family addiction module toxin [Streptomyces sp. NPDC014676]|uniref:Txe/YoeB family addiction module toxin n=1 Tax=Streptomyces sp. NPDC014676 TaxID=3364879 RepID=UPI0036FBAD7A
MRDVRFRPTGWEDLPYWQAADKTLFRKLVRLIGEIQRGPFTGIGKPEPLKGDLSGYRSRRNDDEHRLVHRATEKEAVIIKARYHY